MALAGSKWHGKSTSDVVKVGQSATLLVGEMRCPGRGLRVNPIFFRTFCYGLFGFVFSHCSACL
jgi:hypothetical protein